MKENMKNKKYQKIRDDIIGDLGFLSYTLLSIIFIPLTFIWWVVNDKSFMDSNIFGNLIDFYEHYGGNI